MSLIAALLISSLSLSFAGTTICGDLNCNIKPEKGDTVACECGVSICELDCSGDKNCQDIVFYSAAAKTTVVCPGEDSCKQSAFNSGVFEVDDLPDSLVEAKLGEAKLGEPRCAQTSFELKCEAESSCKESNVTATSTSSVLITASAKDAFDESIVDCSNKVTECSLTCSDTVTSCDDAECNDKCKCTGKMCPGWTKKPTSPPVVDVDPVDPSAAPQPAPTNKPTPAPVPAYVRCTSDDISNGVCTLNNLEGGDQVVVTANEGVDELVINCKRSQQCKKDSKGPLTVFSAANTTRINCGEKGSDAEESCKDGVFYIGNQDEPPKGFKENDFVAEGSFDTVLLNCYGKQSCKEANLTANGKFVTIEVMALGEQSYQDSKTECDAPSKCILKCNENEPDTCGYPICEAPCEINNMPMRQAIKRIFADEKRITGSVGGTAIFTNEDQDCFVDCSGVDQCKSDKKPFQVFSGCNRTVIDCSGYAACKEAEIFVGAIDSNLPDGTEAADFSGVKESLTIICGETGCELANIITKGVIKSVTITGRQQASLKKADIICGSNNCVLNCGQKGSDADSCQDLDINCDSGCVCNGGSCVDITASPKDGTRLNTPAPTSVTATPTKEPTTNPTSPTAEPTTSTTTASPTTAEPTESPIPAPTKDPTTPEPTESPTKKPTTSPTRSPTTSDKVSYTPNGKSILVCKNNVDTCEIDCNNAHEQCSGEMKVLSGANITQVFCDEVDACKGATILVGSAVTEEILSDLGLNLSPSDFVNRATIVEVDCQAEAGCKEINIQVNQELSFGVFVLGGANKDTLEKATISVTGGFCSVNCGSDAETPSCKELTVSGRCSCSGGNCPTARISGITSLPNGDDINGEKHYPTFLQMIMMGCIGFGLMCLIGFFVYFKFFGNKGFNTKLLNDDGINYNVYNTFSGNDSRALEMESYLK